MKNEGAFPVIGSLGDIPENGAVKENFDPAKILHSCRVDPLKVIEAPPVMVQIGETPAMTAGNFSLLIGKAKSRKTFFQTGIVAAAVSGETRLGRITGTLPEIQRHVLLFDTEQSGYHLYRTVNRICRMASESNPANFSGYGLRKYTPAERVKIIEYAIYNTPGLGFVAIDGLRDLLSKGINDEEEATAITSKLLRWTAERDIHILLVLHQNKNDQNARGHVGTECLNKAETVISVTLAEDKQTTLVEGEFTRDIPFEGFAFTINETGLPVECDLPDTNSNKEKRTKSPTTINDDEHFRVLASIYKQNPKPTYNEFRDAIIYGFGGTFGQSACRQFISHYLNNGWVIKNPEGHKVIYEYARAIF